MLPRARRRRLVRARHGKTQAQVPRRLRRRARERQPALHADVALSRRPQATYPCMTRCAAARSGKRSAPCPAPCTPDACAFEHAPRL
eukprot:5587690-Pleurochrysis_carterae.AAC.1